MAIYEVRITRRVIAEDYVDLTVRAKTATAARIKAERLAKANNNQYFGPLDCSPTLEIGGADKLDFIPDCEVL